MNTAKGRLTLSRRELLLIPLASTFASVVSGCLPLARLFIARGLAAGLTRAGGLMTAARAGAGGLGAARMVTFGRAASVGFTPSASRALAQHRAISVLESGGRSLGSIQGSRNVITLSNARGQRLVRSESTNGNAVHYDPFGQNIGFSRIEKGGTRLTHWSSRRDFLGSDTVAVNKLEHFDKSGRLMGTSRLETSAANSSSEVVATAGLGELMLAYSASFIYRDPEASKLYEELRDIQHRCFVEDDESACRRLKFLNGQLETLLRATRS